MAVPTQTASRISRYGLAGTPISAITRPTSDSTVPAQILMSAASTAPRSISRPNRTNTVVPIDPSRLPAWV